MKSSTKKKLSTKEIHEEHDTPKEPPPGDLMFFTDAMAGGYGTEHDSEFGFDDTPEDKLPKL
jgi:hypothetical protein